MEKSFGNFLGESQFLGRKAPRAKFWRKMLPTRAKMRRKFGEVFRRFSSFNFQEKWAQEIHEKSSTNSTSHATKFFHRKTLGAWGHNISVT